MQITITLFVCLLAIVISQAVFASGLLWFAKKNKLSNRLLSILISCIGLWLCDNFLRMSLIYRQLPNLYFLPIFYSFAFGPLIYFYVRSLTNPNFKFKRIFLLHFIPVTIQASLYIFLTFKDYAFKNWFWQNIHAPFTYRIEFDGTWISLTIYLILSFRFIRNYQSWLANNYSETSKTRLNWLKIILLVLMILCLQWPIEIILRDVFNIYFEYNYSILILGVVALILGIGGLRQANLSNINFIGDEDKHDKKSMPFEIDPIVLNKIIEIMVNEKLYLNPTLNLIEFARALQINPKQVSKHLNTGLNQSFNDFVNQYRIEEVKRRLKSDDVKRLTILAIAYESGFNSKTTFHRTFKTVTGIAPSDYIA